MKSIYLDYAAATPMDPNVLEAMRPYFSDNFYNPSATYLAGQAARQALGEARAKVAAHLGARPAEIIFTAGATEANNLAIQGVARQFPDAEVLVSAVEHESVLAPAKLGACRQIPVDKQGVVQLGALQKMVSDKTVLVSVMYVNNELGTIQPLSEISKILNKLSISRRAKGNDLPLYLHTDAAQAGNYLDLHAARLGVDMMSLNGGKLYGPKQTGALYTRAGTRIGPLIVGGGQEFGLRSGTENLAGAAGFSLALELAQGQRVAENERVKALRDEFWLALSAKVPAAVINGAAKRRSPHVLNVSFPGIDNERLMMELDEAGVQCATGSACSAASGEPSHVLSAIGLTEAEARSSLRFSFGHGTSPGDIQKTVDLLARLAANR